MAETGTNANGKGLEKIVNFYIKYWKWLENWENMGGGDKLSFWDTM